MKLTETPPDFFPGEGEEAVRFAPRWGVWGRPDEWKARGILGFSCWGGARPAFGSKGRRLLLGWSERGLDWLLEGKPVQLHCTRELLHPARGCDRDYDTKGEAQCLIRRFLLNRNCLRSPVRVPSLFTSTAVYMCNTRVPSIPGRITIFLHLLRTWDRENSVAACPSKYGETSIVRQRIRIHVVVRGLR